MLCAIARGGIGSGCRIQFMNAGTTHPQLTKIRHPVIKTLGFTAHYTGDVMLLYRLVVIDDMVHLVKVLPGIVHIGVQGSRICCSSSICSLRKGVFSYRGIIGFLLTPLILIVVVKVIGEVL